MNNFSIIAVAELCLQGPCVCAWIVYLQTWFLLKHTVFGSLKVQNRHFHLSLCPMAFLSQLLPIDSLYFSHVGRQQKR
jgi:hypothetical protein